MNFKIIIFLLTLFFVSTLQRRIQWDSIKPMAMVRNPKAQTSGETNGKTLHLNMKEVQSRVVGGFEAGERMFPYQAAINIDTPNGTYFCGGSVISQRTILTAAHCAVGATGFVVLLGSNSLTDETPGDLEIQTNTSIVHPDYNPDTIVNDIALIILGEDIPFSKQISPVPLAPRSSQNDNIVGKIAVVSGWGKTSDLALGITRDLRYTYVRTTNSSVCQTYFGQFPKNDICVSGKSFTGSCSGDSGGPLTINGKQVGIVSFGGLLCQAGIPSGYTRVAPYIDFIMQNSDYTE